MSVPETSVTPRSGYMSDSNSPALACSSLRDSVPSSTNRVVVDVGVEDERSDELFAVEDVDDAVDLGHPEPVAVPTPNPLGSSGLDRRCSRSSKLFAEWLRGERELRAGPRAPWRALTATASRVPSSSSESGARSKEHPFVVSQAGLVGRVAGDVDSQCELLHAFLLVV